MGLPVEMATASAASGLATIVANPFEIAKTRLQVQRGLGKETGAASAGVPRYTGSIHAIRSIARLEGVAGLYKGFGGFAGYRVSMNGVRLGLYHPVRQWLKQGPLHDSPVAIDLVAAGSTGAAGAVAGNPFNVVKMRCMTVPLNSNTSTSMTSVAREMVKKEGVGSFGLGMSAGVPRVMCGSIAQLTTYEAIKRFLSNGANTDENYAVQTVASIISSAVSTTCFCPFDVISSRLMAGAAGGYTGFFDCLAKTVKVEGVWALQRGWLALFARTGPTSTVTLVLWEAFRVAAGANVLDGDDE